MHAAAASAKVDAARILAIRMDFTQEWCDTFFQHSGDKNVEFHSGPHAFVQGAAIITKFATAVSELLPGYQVVRIGTLAFHAKIRPGDSLVLTLDIEKEKRGLLYATAIITRDAQEEVMDPIELVLWKSHHG